VLAPENLPTILQNPDIVTLVLKYLKIKDTDDKMPAVLINWNQAGFNDPTFQVVITNILTITP